MARTKAPSDEAQETDGIAVGRLTSVDAFEDPEDGEESVDLLPGEPTTANSAAEKITIGQPDPDLTGPGFVAMLQDVKVSAASNGNNFDVTFETAMENLDDLARLAVGGVIITWRKVLIGNGGEVRRMAVTRDADGALHLKVAFHLPQSEISRSVGFLGPLVAMKGMLELEEMQQTLRLEDGREIDLTSRAE
jgi:hypothetical protein